MSLCACILGLGRETYTLVNRDGKRVSERKREGSQSETEIPTKTGERDRHTDRETEKIETEETDRQAGRLRDKERHTDRQT